MQLFQKSFDHSLAGGEHVFQSFFHGSGCFLNFDFGVDSFQAADFFFLCIGEGSFVEVVFVTRVEVIAFVGPFPFAGGVGGIVFFYLFDEAVEVAQIAGLGEGESLCASTGQEKCHGKYGENSFIHGLFFCFQRTKVQKIHE